jgi:hypothetical protein
MPRTSTIHSGMYLFIRPSGHTGALQPEHGFTLPTFHATTFLLPVILPAYNRLEFRMTPIPLVPLSRPQPVFTCHWYNLYLSVAYPAPKHFFFFGQVLTPWHLSKLFAAILECLIIKAKYLYTAYFFRTWR